MKMKKMKLTKMSKKGYSYLLVASIIIAIVLIVFLTSQRYKFQDKQEITEIRIKTINDFIKGFNDDIQRSTYISSFRTFLALEDQISQSGTYFNSTKEVFKETFYNGTINGVEKDILNGSSFEDYISKVNILSNNMGINTTIRVLDINIKHSDPWHLQVDIDTEISVDDVNGIASWNFNKTFITQVPIYDLRDPLYAVNTNNRVPNTVVRTPNTTLVNSINNDTANLVAHIEESYYIESTDAPNFLMRFENNMSPDIYGIESIVNIEDLSDQDIDVYADRVKIDYIYFNNLATDKICNIDNIPASKYLVLPSNRETLYQVDGLSYSTSCP